MYRNILHSYYQPFSSQLVNREKYLFFLNDFLERECLPDLISIEVVDEDEGLPEEEKMREGMPTFFW
jgi:hypothetical protein